MMLSKDKVARIKALIVEGKKTQPEIAGLCGVSRSLVSDIATGRARKRALARRL